MALNPQPILGNWRVILRFSLDYDKNSAVRNAISPILRQCGIKRIVKTGTWESAIPHSNPIAAADQLSIVLKMLSTPQASVNGAGPHAQLDHFWLYVERVK